MPSIYVKEDKSITVSDRFTYEVTVCCYYSNYYCITDTTIFESDINLEKMVESYFLNKHIQISCELFSAPMEYIIEEGYKLWVEPPKKTRKPKKK